MPDPVMTQAGQRAALVALLKTVTGMGVVWDYRRIVRTENEIRQLFVPKNSPTGAVNAWLISPSGNSTTVTERNPGHHGKGIKGGGNVFTTFQWQIEAYYGIDDAKETEKTFSDLAWRAADELNAYGQLDIVGLVMQLPADIEQFGYISLAGVQLCHYARIGIAFQGRTRPA